MRRNHFKLDDRENNSVQINLSFPIGENKSVQNMVKLASAKINPHEN